MTIITYFSKTVSFLQQKNGYIAVFSLNDPSYPEYLFPTPSGVVCLDTHPNFSYFIVVGFYDGNVAVFNLEKKSKKPLSHSNSWRGKHLDPVWQVEIVNAEEELDDGEIGERMLLFFWILFQVQWQSNDMDGNLKFYSAGGDGKLTEWTLIKVIANSH